MDYRIILAGGVSVAALFLAITISMFAPDKLAQRIAACMQQPGMQYYVGQCIPVEKDPSE